MTDADLLKAQADFEQWAHADSVYPIRFPNGCGLGEMKAKCPDCDALIERDDVRYNVYMMHEGHTAVVNALAGCRECHAYARTHHRVKTYGTQLRFEIQRDGRWVSLVPKRKRQLSVNE